jgi:hypothetical protein
MFCFSDDDLRINYDYDGDLYTALSCWPFHMYHEWVQRGYSRTIWAAEYRKLSDWIHRAIAEQKRIDRRLAIAMAFHARLGQDSPLSEIADMCAIFVPDI